MSIVALAESGKSTVTEEILHDVAAKNNITITNPTDISAYLLVLQSADATASLVNNLPDYIDPRLSPIPTTISPRSYSKPPPFQNTHNAWSHLTSLLATSPATSTLSSRRIAIKDNVSVSGLPYTCGMFPSGHTSDTHPISPIDATVVRRILDAGGHIVGTSTCENYSLTPMSYTSANGPVSNPWLSGYNTGGSSSGNACLLAIPAARAAGVPGLENASGGVEDIDIAMGGDQAGSIRLPASYCGVYGLKPTYGLVPYTGIAGLAPLIDYTGPMGRDLIGLAELLGVVAGWDGLDGRMGPETPLRNQVKDYAAELAKFGEGVEKGEMGKGLKVGIISESLTSIGTSEEVARVVKESAIKHFTAAGATVSQVSIPIHLLAPAIWTASSRNNMASLTVQGRVPDILTHNLPHFQPKWPPSQEMFDLLTHHNPAVVNVLFGQTFLNEKYGTEVQAKAHRHVFQLRAAYDAALAEYDILITPTTPTVAPKLPDMKPEAEGGTSLMDKLLMAVGSTNNTCPFNASGHPALSVPCGWGRSADGKGWLPVGMQIVGKMWDDGGLLRAAKVWEGGGGGLGAWPGRIE